MAKDCDIDTKRPSHKVDSRLVKTHPCENMKIDLKPSSKNQLTKKQELNKHLRFLVCTFNLSRSKQLTLRRPAIIPKNKTIVLQTQ